MSISHQGDERAIIVNDLEDLARLLKQHAEAIAHNTLITKKQRRFKKNILKYVVKVHNLENEFKPRILGIGRDITRYAVKQRSKQQDPEIIDLWHRLANAITCLSEHPTKKVATLIVGADHMLEAATVNRIPPGTDLSSSYFVAGKRKDFFICSERLAIAETLGLKPNTLDLKYVTRGMRPDFVRNNISGFSEAIRIAGKNNPTFNDSILITTTTPCDLCLETIGPYRPRAVHADSRSGKNFTRRIDFGHAGTFLTGYGVPLIDLAPRL